LGNESPLSFNYMWVFWILSLLPISIGLFLWLKDKKIVLWEWLTGCGVSLLTALIFQYVACIGMTDDVETWSGQVIQSIEYSRWKEYYEYAVYRTEYYYVTVDDYSTDNKGRTYRSGSHREQRSREVFDHWEPTSCWHRATWNVDTSLGNHGIDEVKFNYLCHKFGDKHTVQGNRVTGEHNSRMIDGDPNDYVAFNLKGWIEPVSDTKHFENRIKASPSLFSFVKVPTNISVFTWPETKRLFDTTRLMGNARQRISVLEWDQLNSVLGPTKKVNLILIGFTNNTPREYARWQEAAWIGGKKNDLVMCYAGDNTNTQWSYVFGWTEKALVKRNLESLLLNNEIDHDLVSKIKNEVIANYEIKDWKKFDYITIEPPSWSYWVYFLVMIITQTGLYIFFHKNLFDKDNAGYRPVPKWGSY